MKMNLKKSLVMAVAFGLSLSMLETAHASTMLKLYGLTNTGHLVSFFSNKPNQISDLGTIMDEGGKALSLVGIDFRVQDGKLYGVSMEGNVYTINTDTANATLVNSLSVPLSGMAFGVDFNPAADRLRIVSDAGQNLRHNVNFGGVTIDDSQGGLVPLSYVAPPAVPVAAKGITGVAYTNNDLSTMTATTMFDLDANLDQLAIQAPPNLGLLNLTGLLGFNADPNAVGFDIYSKLSKKGVAGTNQGFASLNVNGKTMLYSVKLLTGTLRSMGELSMPVSDIAVALQQ